MWRISHSLNMKNFSLILNSYVRLKVLKMIKQGKIAEVVLKRSIFKNINAKNEKIVSGAVIAGDCGIHEGMSGRIGVATSGVVDYARNDVEYYTFYKAFNNLIAKGYRPITLSMNVIMPEKAKEKQVKELVKRYDNLCKLHKMEISNGHTQYSEKVNEIITSVTMIGEKIQGNCDIIKDSVNVESNKLQIVMTKAIGIEGTAIISADREDILRERFHGTFCDECIKFKEYVSVEKEALVAGANGAVYMHDVSGTGVYGAIWEMASAFGCGAEIELLRIPVWQETIEVTELFDINPYKMASQGALLILVEDGDKMVEALEQEGIPAVVIGKLIEGNDKILVNQDETRYLEPPRGDDIYLAHK